MAQQLVSQHQRQDEFDPTIVSFSKPTKHYRYLNDQKGDWLATRDGKSLFLQGHVDDAAIWDESNGGFKHVLTGMQVSSTSVAVESACKLSTEEGFLNEEAQVGDPSEFSVGHGPELLPSEYLKTLREQGWVSLTCVLSPSVVDGLQRVGCVDSYAQRTPERVTPLVPRSFGYEGHRRTYIAMADARIYRDPRYPPRTPSRYLRSHPR